MRHVVYINKQHKFGLDSPVLAYCDDNYHSKTCTWSQTYSRTGAKNKASESQVDKSINKHHL